MSFPCHVAPLRHGGQYQTLGTLYHCYRFEECRQRKFGHRSFEGSWRVLLPAQWPALPHPQGCGVHSWIVQRLECDKDCLGLHQQSMSCCRFSIGNGLNNEIGLDRDLVTMKVEGLNAVQIHGLRGKWCWDCGEEISNLNARWNRTTNRND